MQLLAMLQMIVPIDSGECFCLLYYCIVLMYRGHKLEHYNSVRIVSVILVTCLLLWCHHCNLTLTKEIVLQFLFEAVVMF